MCVRENSLLLVFMCPVNSYKANYRQHSVNTGNYIMDEHNIKSKRNYRQALQKKHVNIEKVNKQRGREVTST
jgi:hypothetical protein